MKSISLLLLYKTFNNMITKLISNLFTILWSFQFYFAVEKFEFSKWRKIKLFST